LKSILKLSCKLVENSSYKDLASPYYLKPHAAGRYQLVTTQYQPTETRHPVVMELYQYLQAFSATRGQKVSNNCTKPGWK